MAKEKENSPIGKEKEKEKKLNEKHAKLAAAKKSRKSPLKYFREARAEFKKVIWPAPKQVLNNTTAVLTMLVIAGAAVWGLDTLLDWLIKTILKVG